jgi:hypothetical protein
MSRSITDLLKQLSLKAKNPPPASGKLDNPDIPNLHKAIADREKIRTLYYSSMKLPSMPRNGTGYDLDGRAGKVENPRLDDFMLESSIDPNQIRRKTDPDRALPDLFSAGSQNAYFQAPPGAYVAHDQLSLVRQAHQSYANYKRRFDIPPEPIPVIPV